jgi:hypothetical protein
MAPPGLRFAGGASYVYAVSNDDILHSMNGGSTGGDWPSSWTPYQLGGPAQSRPPVVSFPVGSAATGAAFVGSQDGSVYAINALDGSEAWKRHISAGVQAAPAGHFRAFAATAFDLVIVGTRDPNGPNQLVALDMSTGNPVWSFDNSLAQGGDGKEIGIVSGSASIDYQMKRAFFASTRAGVTEATERCGASISRAVRPRFDGPSPSEISKGPVISVAWSTWGRSPGRVPSIAICPATIAGPIHPGRSHQGVHQTRFPTIEC